MYSYLVVFQSVNIVMAQHLKKKKVQHLFLIIKYDGVLNHQSVLSRRLAKR